MQNLSALIKIMTIHSSHKVRFITPPNTLKTKVGHGGIDKALIKKSQKLIENVEINFLPYAQDFIKKFSIAIKEAIKDSSDFEATRESLVAPIMQLKANGGMFRYILVSDIADIALQFLDNLSEINKDGIDVLKAHENTITVIINSNLKGDGGKEGYALVKELHSACNRYFKKYKPPE